MKRVTSSFIGSRIIKGIGQVERLQALRAQTFRDNCYWSSPATVTGVEHFHRLVYV